MTKLTILIRGVLATILVVGGIALAGCGKDASTGSSSGTSSGKAQTSDGAANKF